MLPCHPFIDLREGEFDISETTVPPGLFVARRMAAQTAHESPSKGQRVLIDCRRIAPATQASSAALIADMKYHEIKRLIWRRRRQMKSLSAVRVRLGGGGGGTGGVGGGGVECRCALR